MTYPELLNRHPQLTYKSYKYKFSSELLILTYHFRLEPDIDFYPVIEIPFKGNFDENGLNNFAFNLGLVESISYWKLACPRDFKIEAGLLNSDQQEWWHDLYIKGLGEFFYRNGIDFTQSKFLTITSSGQTHSMDKNVSSQNKTLILVGGGKDTAVTLDIMQRQSKPIGVLANNAYPNTMALLDTAGIQNPILVRRVIDPQLLKLNAQGYLNGHTPFSAYLAFLGVLVADLYGYDQVIVSNEQSANQANLSFKNFSINHQYSKSFEFELIFRKYCKNYLSSGISYFSILRPLNELQLGQKFAALTQYHTSAISCNVNRGVSWCGECPKCVFSYLILAPFLDDQDLLYIFSTNIFNAEKNYLILEKLVGLGSNKPWECVGTFEESQAAVYLAQKKHPDYFLLRKILSKLNKTDKELNLIAKDSLAGWSDNHFIPEEFLAGIKNIAAYE